MRLALGLGDVDEIGVGQSPGLLQYRPSDRDVVILGELAHDPERSIPARCQKVGEFGTCLALNFLDQGPEHVIENADMLLVEAARAFEEQVGDAPQGTGPPFGCSVLDDLLEFGNQRGGGCPLGGLQRFAFNREGKRRPPVKKGVWKEGLSPVDPRGPFKGAPKMYIFVLAEMGYLIAVGFDPMGFGGGVPPGPRFFLFPRAGLWKTAQFSGFL